MATCEHADAAPYAFGLCYRCYHRDYRQRAKQLEDPRSRKYKIQPEYLDPIPLRPPNVTAWTFTATSIPEECPHCRRTYALVFVGREAHCDGSHGGCGWTAYQVRAGP